MNEPYLAVYVKDDALIITKKLPKEAKPRKIFELPIEEILADEFADAASKLGTTLLGILALWHKAQFHDWGTLQSVDENDGDERTDFGIAMELISQSVASKTSAHVQSIELLLRQQAIKTESAQKFLDESWPAIRDRLRSFS